MLNELSLFVDESGSEGKGSKYYLLTLVFHNQSNDILNNIAAYEQTLKDKSLPDVPFHASPLMNGNDEYEGFDMATRKKLLAAFASFVRRLPIAYTFGSWVCISKGLCFIQELRRYCLSAFSGRRSPLHPRAHCA